MGSIPRIISVDDHVVEPPDLWSSRLPSGLRERGPRLVRERGRPVVTAFATWQPSDDGEWADIWYYDDLVTPVSRMSAAVGLGELRWGTVIYDEMRPGARFQRERLLDMDANHVDVSLCFPNTLPRFCGQTFAEREDKELALLCVQAYNDWIIDEWCAGDGYGRLVPITMVPLWDVDLAVEEVRRCADHGAYAVTFPENPYSLGLPSVYSGEWDPFFRECAETDTVVCLHIGSSSKMPQTQPDAPFIVTSTLQFQNSMHSVLDFAFSGSYDDSELRSTVQSSESALTDVETEQAQAREEITKERKEIDSDLEAAKVQRAGKTGGVSRALLGKYDRIRTRRTQALYALRGESCGNCDTAIPMQRRNQMAVNGPIDVCEACGVLLYRADTA